jgi:O-antigen/teichoic acid export membrane protein
MAVGEVAIRLKAIVLLPLLTHYFGTTRYGAWAQVAVFAGLVPPLIVLGTDTAISRFLPGTEPEHQARWFTGWILGLAMFAVPICLFLYFAKTPIAVMFFGTANPYASLVPIAVLYVFVTVMILAARTWFRIRNQAAWYSAVGIGLALIGAGAVVLTVTMHQGVYQAVLYETVGDIVFAVVLLLKILRVHGWARPDMTALRPLVRFGLPILPAAYAMWAVNWLDRIFLVKYTNLSAIGVYSLAYTIGALVVQMSLTSMWTMFPNVSAGLWNEGRRDQVQKLFDRCTGVSTALLLPAIAGAAVISGATLRLIAPAGFAAGAPVVAIVLGGYGAAMLAAYYEALFWCVHRPGLSTIAVGLAFVVNLGLNFALIPTFGYIGAAIATAAAFVVQLAFCMALATRLGLIRTRLRTPLLIALATVVMTIATLLVRSFVGGEGLGDVGIVVVTGIVVYAAAIVMFRVVSPRVIWTRIRAGVRPKRAAPVPADSSAWTAAGSS